MRLRGFMMKEKNEITMSEKEYGMLMENQIPKPLRKNIEKMVKEGRPKEEQGKPATNICKET